jgi:hypothetical protein
MKLKYYPVWGTAALLLGIMISIIGFKQNGYLSLGIDATFLGFGLFLVYGDYVQNKSYAEPVDSDRRIKIRLCSFAFLALSGLYNGLLGVHSFWPLTLSICVFLVSFIPTKKTVPTSN